MRFGIREIANVVFKARTDTRIGNKNFKAGQPVLYIDTAKTSTLEGAATTVYAQGGQGNPRLIAWEGERTVTFTVEDALISPISLAMLTGAGVVNASGGEDGKRINVHTTFDLPILEGGKVRINLDTAGDDHDIYYDGENAQIYGTILDLAGAPVVFCELSEIAGPAENCNVYTITRDKALELTFSGADKYVGKTIRVDCYAQKTSGATQLTITADKFAGNYYVEADTLFREQYSGEDMPAVITIPNVKIQSNFTFSMAASGDPSTFTFTMDAFPAYTYFDRTQKVLAAIDFVGEENIHPDEAGATTDDTCAEPEVHFDSIEAGVQEDWEKTSYPEDPKNINWNDLGNNLQATIDLANVDFTGNLNRVDNWTAFSENPDDLTGYYYPMRITTEPGSKIIMTTHDGGTKECTIEDGTLEMIKAIRPEEPVYTVTLENESGDQQEYSFDFSKVVFK